MNAYLKAALITVVTIAVVSRVPSIAKTVFNQ